MNRKILEDRTKRFHVAVIRLCELLPRNASGFELSKQVIRSAGSIGANYRASMRSKSKADFIYKIQVVLEEADESHYWLEIIQLSGLITGDAINELIQEAYELTAIFSATDRTAKANLKKNSTTSSTQNRSL
jgi:four helix bundle protein